MQAAEGCVFYRQTGARQLEASKGAAQARYLPMRSDFAPSPITTYTTTITKCYKK